MLKLKDGDFYKYVQKRVWKSLTEGFQTKQLIDIAGLSGVGLTNVLVKFAKRYNLNVVLNDNQDRANFLKTKYKYENVYTVEHVRDKKWLSGQLVVDVGVDRDELQHQYGLQVMTGYYSKQN